MRAAAHPQADAAAPSVLADVLTLAKARITAMVGFAALAGALLAGGTERLGAALSAAGLVALASAGAGILNQVLERELDARMRRTRDRPLPAGRVTVAAAIGLGAAAAVLSSVGLVVFHGLLAALLALGTLFLYVAVYTPLKRASTLNTVVGAIPGAAPPLVGYVAIAGAPGAWAWALFAILFVWQFPHFFAIAWLWRDDYARAGLAMLPALPGGEHVAARSALVHALVLLPISLLPALWGVAGGVFVAVALVAGLAYVAAAARFAWREDERRARILLYTSLAYVPVVFLAALADGGGA